MEKKAKKKIEAPLVLKTGFEGGWKSALLLDKNLILIADGKGNLQLYDYEKSENVQEFIPNEGKIIFSLQSSEDILDMENDIKYKLLYVMYKDGVIDIFLLYVNEKLQLFDENLHIILSVQSPMSLMTQIPKLEYVYSDYFLGIIQSGEDNKEGEDFKEESKVNIITHLFSQISNVDRASKNGSINVVEFSKEGNYVFLGFENGTVVVMKHIKESNSVIQLTKGYQIDSSGEEPAIILSILAIPESESSFTLIWGSYKNKIYILNWSISEDKLNLKKKISKWAELSLLTVQEKTSMKPGISNLKFLEEFQCYLAGWFDYRIRLFRIKNRSKPRLVGLLKHHHGIINSIDLRTKDERWEVLAASEDGSVTLWTLEF